MVELGCGKTCMKYILFVINFLFFLLGAAAFGLGIWALVDKNKMNVLTKVGAEDSDFNVVGLLESAAIVLLVGGAAILLIGFLGCCGAMKQSQCLLCLYAVFLLVIVIVELAAIVIAAMFQGQVQDELKDFLKKNINSTYEGKIDTSEEFSLGIDYAQVYFQCCGIDSWEDFAGAQKWNRTANVKIPETCCILVDKDDYLKDQKAKLKDPNCPTNPTATNSNFEKPCWDSIESYLKDRIAIVIGIAAGILALEVQDELKDFLKKNINSTYEGKIDTSEEFSLGIDYAQVYFQCCGIDSWEDFAGAQKWNRTANVKIPETCCILVDKDDYLKDQKAKLKDPNCPTNPTATNSNFEKPCWDSIESYLKDRIAIVIGIAAGILALEVICVVFACCIISELRKGD